MNRKMIVALVIIASAYATMTVAQNTSAPAPQPSKDCCHVVGVLDLVRVFNEANQIQDLNDMMKEQAEQFAKEAEQRRKIIEDKQNHLQALRPGTQEHSDLRRDLLRLNIDANVWLKTSEAQVDQDKFEWTKVIYEKTVRISGEVSKERGYDVVLLRNTFKPDEIELNVNTLRRYLQDRTVIYNTPEVDVTDIVIRRLNEEYKAGGGKKQLGQMAPLTTPTP